LSGKHLQIGRSGVDRAQSVHNAVRRFAADRMGECIALGGA
jgi:hypothetical protein